VTEKRGDPRSQVKVNSKVYRFKISDFLK